MRKHKRLTLDLPAAVRTAEGGSGNKVFLIRTANVSAGGALFFSGQGLPVGMGVSVVLFLRSKTGKADRHVRVSFRGKVIRSEPGRFAVAFAGTGQAAGLQAMSKPGELAPNLSCSISKRPDKERT